MKKNDKRKGNSGRRPYTNNVPFSNRRMIDIRLEHNWSQRELAEKVGVSRSTYTKIESGMCRGSEDFWKKITHIFGVSDKEELIG